MLPNASFRSRYYTSSWAVAEFLLRSLSTPVLVFPNGVYTYSQMFQIQRRRWDFRDRTCNSLINYRHLNIQWRSLKIFTECDAWNAARSSVSWLACVEFVREHLLIIRHVWESERRYAGAGFEKCWVSRALFTSLWSKRISLIVSRSTIDKARASFRNSR